MLYRFSIFDGSRSDSSAFTDGVIGVGRVDFQRPVFWFRWMFGCLATCLCLPLGAPKLRYQDSRDFAAGPSGAITPSQAAMHMIYPYQVSKYPLRV